MVTKSLHNVRQKVQCKVHVFNLTIQSKGLYLIHKLLTNTNIAGHINQIPIFWGLHGVIHNHYYVNPPRGNHGTMIKVC